MNYLAHKIQPLPRRTKPGGRRTKQPDEMPPNCYRQIHIAIAFDIPALAIRRAIDRGLIDCDYNSKNDRVVVRNERLAEFIARWKSGDRMRLTTARVHHTAKSYQARDKFILSLYRSGYTVAYIADLLGVSNKTIYRCFAANDEKTRSRSDALRRAWKTGRRKYNPKSKRKPQQNMGAEA